MSAAGRVYALALTAFREAVRDRVLFGVLGLGTASVLFGMGLGAVSYGEALRVFVDHGIVTISWLSNLVAIFLGASFLYKELELRTLYVVLARPVSRHEFVLGKYLGILVTVLVFLAITASLVLVLAIVTATDETASAAQRAAEVFSPFRKRGVRMAAVAIVAALGTTVLLVPRVRRSLGVGAVLPVSLGFFAVFAAIARLVVPAEATFIFAGCWLVLAEVCVTAGAAMLFSSFSTPFVTGLLATGFFVISRSTWLMQHATTSRLPAVFRIGLRGLSRAVPNLHLYVPSRPILVPDDPTRPALRYLAGGALYAALWAALLVAASMALFRRRDLV